MIQIAASKLSILLVIIVFLFNGLSCKNGANGSKNSGSSYNFSTPINNKLHISSSPSFEPLSSKVINNKNLTKKKVDTKSSTGPTLCSSVICFTPTAISGKYYGTGLLIQSQGNGMMAYFGQDNWSSIVGTSISYNFDMSSPVTNVGNLVCCTSSGNLADGNAYIESVAYLFSYLDVTFAVSGIVTGNTSMNSTYTLRFVMADGAITDGLRGDILIYDAGSFKWMNSDDSSLSTTRPTNPVVMNTSVTNWTNPFGANQGNQTIPVIYSNIIPSTGSTVKTITETELRATNKIYSFGFNPTNFIVFSTLQKADINMIYSLKELLSRVHLGGLPHSGQPMGIGNPADTVLEISE